jgi:UDP-3-O-[3-hydroxymyristoyl] glucosamine N-acyltransferase
MKFKTPVTAKEIAAWTNSEIIGDPNTQVNGLNEIHNVQPGDITFVDHEKVLLYNAKPFEAYNSLAIKLKPELKSNQAISDTAVIGEGTFIFPNAFIGQQVKIGKGCTIHPNVTIYNYCEIGDNVIIHANTTLGSDAFYYKRQASHYDKMHTAGRVIIAGDVEIGAGCTIDAGVSNDTIIGKGTKIDDQVHIGHDVKVGEHCIIAGQVGIAGNTVIGNRVTIYGKSAINKNIEIGDGAIIMASTSVPKSLEGGKTYIGYPAVEARTFAKQVALIKMLPEIWEKFKKL